ncbi:LppA family lipoprotein [Mycobacterium sp.]|uniref:LppA family lipoprotein n=1 Tax=Mycobacterium sp. TaxID=1785 RepID=UPI003D6C1279
MRRRRGVGILAMTAAVAVSACHHYDPYPWPRPGDPSATVLENQLSQRDSLQDAANDLIAVAADMREAVQRAYPATHWSATPGAHGGQSDCGPPFTFLTGTIYELPGWTAPAPPSGAERNAVVAAVADVLRAHHAEKIDVTPGQSVRGTLPREHGYPEFIINNPPAPYRPLMSIKGATGCHHAAPGPGPWDTPATPTPTP